jgi:hypothetical protein
MILSKNSNLYNLYKPPFCQIICVLIHCSVLFPYPILKASTMDRSTPACHPSHLPQPITTIDHNPISRYYQSSNNTSPIPLQCWQGAWGGGAPVFAALSSTHQLFWSAPDTLVEREVLAGDKCHECESAGNIFDQCRKQ